MQFTSAPNVAEAAWMNKVVRPVGCLITGEPYAVEVHHVLGRSARVRADHSLLAIGHAWILPLSQAMHRMRHKDRPRFEIEVLEREATDRYEAERTLFARLMARVDADRLPGGSAMLRAINEYHR